MTTIIQVKINPNAAKNKVEGWQEDLLRIRIHAAPEKGEANEELIEFLSDTLKIGKSKIKILSGHTSRIKRICIEGMTLAEIKGAVS